MTLTREEILAMEPGEDLSELVAVHVMGYEAGVVRLGGWNPSEDISAAWEVADKLKIAIIPQSSSAPDNLKYLARAEWDFRQNEIDVFAATAPEAISKVALLVVLKL